MLAQKGGFFSNLLMVQPGSTVPESLGNVLDDLLVVNTNMAEEIVLVAHLRITFGANSKLLPIAVKKCFLSAGSLFAKIQEIIKY
jgi:hypothetical protein